MDATRQAPGAEQELYSLIIAEVDDARDILQLAEQLVPLLPIRSFDEMAKAGERGRMRFRDTPFDVESLRDFIPPITFPIENARSLVERLAQLIRMVPPHLGVDMESPSGMRRRMRQAGMPGMATPMSGGRSLTAIIRDPTAAPQSLPGEVGRAGM